MFAQQAIPTYLMVPVLNVKHLNTGITRIKHVKNALIPLYLIRKNNNVCVLHMNHMYLKADVFHAIHLIIGIQM